MIHSDFVEFELYWFGKQLFAFLLKSDTPLCVVHQANIINRHKLPKRDHELIAMKTKRIIYVDTNPRLYSFMIHSFQNHFIFPLQIRTCSSIICFQIVILGRPMCPSLFWLGAVQHVTRIQALSFGVVIFTIIAPAKLKYSFFFIRDFLNVIINECKIPVQIFLRVQNCIQVSLPSQAEYQ